MTNGVEIVEDERVPIARLGGDIDMANVGAIGAQVRTAVPNTAHGLVVDLSGTTYLDSQGIAMLLTLGDALAAHGQRLRLVVPPGSRVRRVLDITHIEDRVPLDSSVDEALERIGDAPA